MFARSLRLRSLVIAWIMGVALVLVPVVTALAESGGTKYPH
jgi:hypothetical protein